MSTKTFYEILARKNRISFCGIFIDKIYWGKYRQIRSRKYRFWSRGDRIKRMLDYRTWFWISLEYFFSRCSYSDDIHRLIDNNVKLFTCLASSWPLSFIWFLPLIPLLFRHIAYVLTFSLFRTKPWIHSTGGVLSDVDCS